MKIGNNVTDQEISDFRKYIGELDASFDEWKMLIGFMVTEAAQEHTHLTYLQDEGL